MNKDPGSSDGVLPSPQSCFPASTRALSRALLEAIAKDATVLEEALARVEAHRALEAARDALSDKADVVQVSSVDLVEDEDGSVTFEGQVVRLDRSL